MAAFLKWPIYALLAVVVLASSAAVTYGTVYILVSAARAAWGP